MSVPTGRKRITGMPTVRSGTTEKEGEEAVDPGKKKAVQSWRQKLNENNSPDQCQTANLNLANVSTENQPRTGGN